MRLLFNKQPAPPAHRVHSPPPRRRARILRAFAFVAVLCATIAAMSIATAADVPADDARSGTGGSPVSPTPAATSQSPASPAANSAATGTPASAATSSAPASSAAAAPEKSAGSPASAARNTGGTPVPLSPAPAAPLRVTASFAIVADWVREIGGARVKVETAAPAGADPHAWKPGLRDARRLRDATLLVAIAPDMEDWFARLCASGELRARTVWLGDSAEPAPRPGASARDPHLWLDLALAEKMCARLAAALAAADPAGAPVYAESLRRYTLRLRQMDADARAALATVPASRRLLPTAHDNLSRLARRYGLRSLALNGAATTEAPAPSARRMAAFIRETRAARVPIFHDSPEPEPLVLAATRDAALPPPVRLFTDTLPAPPHPASTYEGMFRENLRRITAALNPDAAQSGTGGSPVSPTPAVTSQSPAAAVPASAATSPAISNTNAGAALDSSAPAARNTGETPVPLPAAAAPQSTAAPATTAKPAPQ